LKVFLREGVSHWWIKSIYTNGLAQYLYFLYIYLRSVKHLTNAIYEAQNGASSVQSAFDRDLWNTWTDWQQILGSPHTHR
jgi:hypothetical protein